MIAPSFGLTATERARPKLKFGFATGNAQPGIDVVRSGVATFFGSNGFVQSASADTQRVDWSNGFAGLLVEESRTNLCLYSQDYTTGWTFADPYSVVNDAEVSPDGTQNADLLLVASGAGSFSANVVRQAITKAASAITYTHSAFYKSSGGNVLSVRIVDVGTSTSNRASVIVSLQTGVVLSAPSVGGGFSNPSVVVEDFGNGWWRIALTFTTDTSTSVTLRAFPYRGLSSFLGDGVNGLLMWGVQLEEASSATSYIPTEATAVKRNADVVTLSGFTDFWRLGSGSALVRARPSSVSGIGPLLQFDDGTADNIIALRGNAANPELYVRTGGVDQAQIDAGTIAADTSYRLAGAWATNDCAASLNSGAPVLDGLATIPTVTQARIGSDGTNYLNGHIEAIEYYDERLPSASLQVLSSQAGRNSIIGSVFRDSIIS